MLKRINLDNKEINFFVISTETGKIKSSGDEVLAETWEDTYVDLNSLVVGQLPSICFNKAHKTRYVNREPVFVDLNYKILSIEKIEEKKHI